MVPSCLPASCHVWKREPRNSPVAPITVKSRFQLQHNDSAPIEFVRETHSPFTSHSSSSANLARIPASTLGLPTPQCYRKWMYSDATMEPYSGWNVFNGRLLRDETWKLGNWRLDPAMDVLIIWELCRPADEPWNERHSRQADEMSQTP